jgi:hypothetical protein
MLPSKNGSIRMMRVGMHAAKQEWRHQNGACGDACCQARMAASEWWVWGCMLPSNYGSIRVVGVGMNVAKQLWQHQSGSCGNECGQATQLPSAVASPGRQPTHTPPHNCCPQQWHHWAATQQAHHLTVAGCCPPAMASLSSNSTGTPPHSCCPQPILTRIHSRLTYKVQQLCGSSSCRNRPPFLQQLFLLAKRQT